MQTSDLPLYRCRRVAGPIQIDGDLAKPIWRAAPAITLGLGDGLGLPRQATTVRGCWDGDYLYLAFDCVDRDIRATMTARDSEVWREEAVEAFICPTGDVRRYFEFECSPANVVYDLAVTNPHGRPEGGTYDGSWNCAGWLTAVRVAGRLNDPGWVSQGWTSEWAIPLAALLPAGGRPAQAGDEWRVNLYRIDQWPVEEYSAWSPTPGTPFSFHRPSRFGRWLLE
jgi:hypothetical protein